MRGKSHAHGCRLGGGDDGNNRYVLPANNPSTSRKSAGTWVSIVLQTSA